MDKPWTRRELRAHVESIGVTAGDVIMIHAALRSVGRMMNGPDALIGAMLDVIGASGTLVSYVSWDECYEDCVDEEGRVPDELRADVPPFDPKASRACRDHGAIAEFVRTTPGALRSGNPRASVAAIGAHASWLVADHPQDYGYGEGSPFAKLVDIGAKVLMAGAPLDTMSILHYAEHKADIPGKRVCRIEVPLLIDGVTHWRFIEEFDTSDPIVEGLHPDYFRHVAEEFLTTSQHARQGLIGRARSVLVPARDIVDFTVAWLEARIGSKPLSA